MIKRAFDEGLDSYEFLGHDEPWKHEWARHFREQQLVRLFAPTLLGRADRFLYERVRPAARRALTAMKRIRGKD
jgi:N-glycosylase/DNA lyase